jgi:pyruvate carboxylase
LKGEEPLTGRPNEQLKPINFEEDFKIFEAEIPAK